MAINVKAGSIILNTVIGPQDVINVGFQPKALIVFGGRRTLEAGNAWSITSYGCASGPGSDQWATGTCFTAATPGVSIGGMKQSVVFLDWGEDIPQLVQAALASFNADGFTLNVQQANGIARKLYYIAIGGSSIEAKATMFDAIGAVGAQSLTGAGFQPKAAIFGTSNISATPSSPVTNNNPMGLGWATGPTAQGVQSLYLGDNAAPPTAGSVILTNKCIALLSNKSTIGEDASLTSFDADGLTLDWTTKTAVLTRIGVMYLGGNAQFACGSFAQVPAPGPQTISGLGFRPAGEFFFGDGKPLGAGPTVHLGQMMGASTLTENVVFTTRQLDGNASPLLPRMQFSETQAIRVVDEADVITCEAVVTSQDIDGFSLNYTQSDTVPRQILFMAFGDVSTADEGKLRFDDRVEQESTTVGLEPFVFGEKLPLRKRWDSMMQERDSAYYGAENRDTVSGAPIDEYEIGIGTMEANGSLRRSVILSSSNNDMPVDFSPGIKTVYNTVPASIIRALLSATNLDGYTTPTVPAPSPSPTPTPTPTPPPAGGGGTTTPSTGPVITPAGTTLANVQAAVSAATAGTTIQLLAGDHNWPTGSLMVPGGVYLKGAGKGITHIRRTAGTTGRIPLVRYDGTNGLPPRVSDISFWGNNGATEALADYGIAFEKGCIDMKVWNCAFRQFSWAAVYVGDAERQRGVIFGCDFIDNFNPSVGNLGYGVSIYGGNTYPALDLGSQHAIFVEDCYFEGQRHSLALNMGGRYVCRYNRFVSTDRAKDYAEVDVHGKSIGPYGGRSYEIYNNTFASTVTVGTKRTAIGMRGGDGAIWGNTIPNTYKYPVELWLEGYTCGTYPAQSQIRSLYIWGNTINVNTTYTTNGIYNNCASSIALNRDYFLSQKAGYTPYTYPHPLR